MLSEKRKESCRKYNQANRIRINEYYRKYYQIHKKRYLKRMRDWQKKHPEVTFLASRKQNAKKYGLSLEQYNIMISISCKICGKKKKGMCIDHDHKTDKIRGVLCGNCNKAIGMFEEDIDRLQKAIVYLGKNL